MSAPVTRRHRELARKSLPSIPRFTADWLEGPVAQALADIEAEARPVWIPVSERMPEPGIDVLVTSGEECCEAWLDHDGEWTTGAGDDEDALGGPPVTHWMPLPETGERDAFREALNDAYNAGLSARAPAVDMPESRWIPVGERMPGDRLAVLAVAHGEVLENSVYRRFGNWYEASTGSSCTLPVSHWMPLPAPPKEPGRE